ncbi:hypothetical protein L596_030237 [Steinernema carpocapsae]|nr:hypothetical protein L596_030237 [Steinernema carpocapsae]
MSCTGCKSFFRRSVVMGKVYACIDSYDGGCVINYTSRRFCQFCRFEKCVKEGMDPAGIQAADKEEAVQIVAYTRKRGRMPNNLFKDGLPPIKVNMRKLLFLENSYERLIDNLCYLESKVVELRTSTIDPVGQGYMDLPDLLKQRCQLADSHKYARPKNWPLTFNWPLQPGMPSMGKHWLLMDLILTVEFCKCFPPFCELKFEDQVALGKCVLLSSCRFSQAYYSYVEKSATFCFPDGVMPFHFHENQTQAEKDVFSGSIEPIRRFGFRKEEYLFLKAIMILNADCRDLSQEGRETIEKRRKEHSTAFLRYLQATYGSLPGASKYADAICIIRTMYEGDEKHKGMHILLEAKMKGISGHLPKLALLETVLFV